MDLPKELPALRMPYGDRALDEADLAADPITQFTFWFTEVLDSGLPEPNAMVVTTASADGHPSARTVLLKDYSDEGFVFFTNFGSRKARELTANPRACLLFPWHALRRQVIVEGSVVRLPPNASAGYFRTRPHGSQLGAWTSRQSSVITSRDELDRRYAELEERWPEDVPAPDFWGGFRVVPESVEFWQGRANRLHDRLRYRLTGPGLGARPGPGPGTAWLVERLAP